MKIHDKFVIELREVIKGYGNDPTVQDPCKFPCDYKFYEIEGVAICEKSFKKMTRLEDEINKAVDKIRAEIEPKCDHINSLASLLPYTAHREIQELLCEIMDLCKAEGSEKE